MCGINGFVSGKHSSESKMDIIRKMNARLAHRGPDNEGAWGDDLVCLGHRRLSIIDLSSESNQPFFSGDKRYVIIYNGELYNYKELKLELQRTTHGSLQMPYFFKTNSDTEVVLAAFLRWGNDCLQRFNGMYAFCIYDSVEKKLTLARDRVGVKPLYYSLCDEGLLFSSEIRPILHSGIKTFIINPETISEYVMYQTVHAPNTIVKDIKMLMPGHIMEYQNGSASITQYYNINKIKNSSDALSYSQICTKINELLGLSVQRRMLADVPFGAFLSGGIDSSAVVGLMSKVSQEKVQTFNVNFDESDFSEAKYARIISKIFNTQHHEIKLSPSDFLSQLPEALAAMDHPSGDGPNTYIVSKATKNAGITMALSGIGGDELFAGYDVFKRMAALQKKAWINLLPLAARKTLGYVLKKQKNSVSGNKINELLSQPEINFNSAYKLNRSLYTRKELGEFLNYSEPYRQVENILQTIPQIEEHLLSSVSLSEINTYLQNILLRDADQMSMAVALEVREPFLDYQLMEFVLSVSDTHKFPHTPKKLLIDSLGDLLPPEVVNRPKMGFTLPWQYWMKNKLKSFCEKNMMEFSEFSFCNKNLVLALWNRFLNGDKTVSWSRIWHIVVLTNWIKENKLAAVE